MNNSNESEKTGWLQKWTNYLKGYQRRYFVLSNGVLSYYKNESEVNINCRGRIALASAVIKPSQNSNFLINKGGNESFHLKAENEIERQKWLNALNLAQREANKNEDEYAESSTDSKSFDDDLQDDLNILFVKLQDIKACQEKLNKSGILLQKLLQDLDILDRQQPDANAQDAPQQALSTQDNPLRSKLIGDILKQFKEKNGSYKIALSSTLNSCNQFSLLAQQYFPKWCKKLKKEQETNKNYEQVINQLANHIKNLEEQIKENNQLPTYSANDEDEKFYDAEEFANSDPHFSLSTVPGKAHRINAAGDLNSSAGGGFKRNSIKNQSFKYELKPQEPDESTASSQASSNLNCANNGKAQFPNDDSDQFAGGRYANNNEDLSSEGRDEDEDEDNLSLNSDEDAKLDNNLDEMIKSSVVLNDAEQRLNDSFSRNSSSNNIVHKYSTSEQSSQEGDSKRQQRVRRTRIPERPNHSLNLWSILKNSIGRDLSKIPMPVNFNEPLSMLQRITEDFEYAELLHKAAKLKDPCEQLTYIAAFCASNYATTGMRTCKPFNPLLGETFECDRMDDLGWKSIAEQVSHHPPMLAMHCRSKDWIVNSEFAISSKFRGKYLQINPIDSNHLEFPQLNYHYTWHKVTTSVHNIIVGKLWIDNHGDMIITNHTTKDKCHLKFAPYSYFSRDVPRKVTGVVLDKENNPKWLIKGSWDSKIEVAKVLKTSSDDVTDGNQRLERTGFSKVIWKRNKLPPDSEKMYNMTKFAIELNEPEEGVAPTDSRLRPDQRLMEDGDWAEANRVKGLLEQKQRDKRKRREELAEQGGELAEYQPTWFTKGFNELAGNSMYHYNGDYWEKRKQQDWSRCPDIFSLDEA